MTAQIFPLPKKNGSIEFTCQECGARIYQAIAVFDYPICMICQWLNERPQIPQHVRDALSGKDHPK